MRSQGQAQHVLETAGGLGGSRERVDWQRGEARAGKAVRMKAPQARLFIRTHKGGLLKLSSCWAPPMGIWIWV